MIKIIIVEARRRQRQNWAKTAIVQPGVSLKEIGQNHKTGARHGHIKEVKMFTVDIMMKNVSLVLFEFSRVESDFFFLW